VTAGTFEP